jgi:hypothetical protein
LGGAELLKINDTISSIWESKFVLWPVRDINGTWLVFTEAERRIKRDGRYEYRAVMSDDYDWADR